MFAIVFKKTMTFHGKEYKAGKAYIVCKSWDSEGRECYLTEGTTITTNGLENWLKHGWCVKKELMVDPSAN